MSCATSEKIFRCCWAYDPATAYLVRKLSGDFQGCVPYCFDQMDSEWNGHGGAIGGAGIHLEERYPGAKEWWQPEDFAVCHHVAGGSPEYVNTPVNVYFRLSCVECVQWAEIQWSFMLWRCIGFDLKTTKWQKFVNIVPATDNCNTPVLEVKPA